MAQAKSQQQSQQLFDLLKRDHRQSEKIMKQIESASAEEREDLFQTLNEALSDHMQMEEQVFYPQLQKIPELQEMVQDALEEHKEAKEYLSEIDDIDVDDDDWFSTFQDLQEGVQHHVQDEENQIFPECKRYLSDDQFAQIVQKCIQFKEQIGEVVLPKQRGATARGQQPGSRQK
ncbi:hemerythrin domain-containing protein [Geobacter sp. SVR]|uniref:hemerythrin domain-containing protein n=1 Tax=Geobacter sp. SVR TaxID=2495594 RepID=UPI00143EF7C9|nr:hemerythrin domain-containing protein [Geobacter sp. SVR]BCS53575.1 hypothetical protein GSVR_18830 [Geobacter sp. SVR]GCF84228.1 hypothetical protein GSbR_08280 [Geobacter sp. SVR]